MRRRKFPHHFENRILEILPNDYSKLQSTKLFNEARKPYVEKRDDGKVNRYKGMGPNTTSYYLKSLIKQGRVDKIRDPKHRKEVYYTKCQRPKTLQLTEQIITEIIPLLERMPKTINEAINSELEYMKKFENVSQDVEKEIAEDKERIGRIVGSVLLEQAFRIIKLSTPELRNLEFYIDSEGMVAPKDLVDKRISLEERMKWLSDNWQETK